MPRGSGTGRVSLLGSAGGTHVSHRPIGGGAFDGGSEGSTTTTDANSVSENGDGSRYNVKKAKKKQSKKRKRLLSDVIHAPISAPEKDDTSTAAASAASNGTEAAEVSNASSKPGKSSLPDFFWKLNAAESPSEMFRWMIWPITPEEFFRDYWEKKPLLIRRKNKKNYYKYLFNSKDIDHMLKNHPLKFGTNVDVTTYTDGVRDTHNIPGRAHPGTVWGFYDEGCSVRLLNPQSFHPPLWRMVASLQEYFSCMVGINTYLTPAGSQGFAPHFDDIEAFILQTEGAKRWRLYENPTGERLPRYSSPNFPQSEIGQPIMDIVLNEGDLLYFPRGVVHQAHALEDKHSLHVTVSTYQLYSWGAYFERLLQGMVEIAYDEVPEMREGLPKGYLDYMGVMHETDNADAAQPPSDAAAGSMTPKAKLKHRAHFEKTAKRMLTRMIECAPLDAAADQMAADFVHTCQPPCLTGDETQWSSRGVRPSDTRKDVPRPFTVSGPCDFRLATKHCARLVVEEGNCNVYHTLDNSRVYRAEPQQFVTFPIEQGEAIEFILNSFPAWNPVCSIPHLEDADAQVELIQHLYDVGIVLVKDDDESKDDK